MFRTIRTALVYLRAVCIHHQYCLVCFTCDFSVAFILRNSSPIGLRVCPAPRPGTASVGTTITDLWNLRSNHSAGL